MAPASSTPRGPAADHDEGEQTALLLAVLAGLGPLEGQQYLGADGGGVLDFLEARANLSQSASL